MLWPSLTCGCVPEMPVICPPLDGLSSISSNRWSSASRTFFAYGPEEMLLPDRISAIAAKAVVAGSICTA